ncbi:glycosyl transferase [Paenibacillus sp. F411]|uniref:glycosyltransferase n=1 Tax=Paenibacillus sp. F411 TaxID=2820239 RepID=UPI001AAE784E|nr:glycosyltransferase [Paenibacillus sp. F411]MBO2944554.1 glycosyl transferase [Paenibacillus sp. F411]
MTMIPKVFHFVFGLKPQTEPFHLSHYMAIASCIEVNRPERVYFHYEHLPYGEWWDRIKDSLVLHPIQQDESMAAYDYKDPSLEQYRYAHLSDISRLEMLLEYGGVYADIDTMFVRPIPEELYRHPCVMGHEKVDLNVSAAREAGGSLCNALIMAEPGSRFIQYWLDSIMQEFDGSWSAHSTFLPYRLSRSFPELVHVEPESSFFHLDWSREGIRRLFHQQVELPENVYSLHLWSHLWWNKERNDFTYFHAGRLTPHFIAHGSSTYSALGRPFLPQDEVYARSVYQREVWRNRVENLALFFRRIQRAWHD